MMLTLQVRMATQRTVSIYASPLRRRKIRSTFDFGSLLSESPRSHRSPSVRMMVTVMMIVIMMMMGGTMQGHGLSLSSLASSVQSQAMVGTNCQLGTGGYNNAMLRSRWTLEKPSLDLKIDNLKCASGKYA